MKHKHNQNAIRRGYGTYPGGWGGRNRFRGRATRPNANCPIVDTVRRYARTPRLTTQISRASGHDCRFPPSNPHLNTSRPNARSCEARHAAVGEAPPGLSGATPNATPEAGPRTRARPGARAARRRCIYRCAGCKRRGQQLRRPCTCFSARGCSSESASGG